MSGVTARVFGRLLAHEFHVTAEPTGFAARLDRSANPVRAANPTERLQRVRDRAGGTVLDRHDEVGDRVNLPKHFALTFRLVGAGGGCANQGEYGDGNDSRTRIHATTLGGTWGAEMAGAGTEGCIQGAAGR